jgi:hypothetical protein
MAEKNSSIAPTSDGAPHVVVSQSSDGANPKRRRTVKIKAALSGQEPAITADEMRIIAAYRAMDVRRQLEACASLQERARTHPARPAPFLRLV